MKTITIERQSTNITALDEALTDSLADDYLGLSVHANMVRVHLVDDTPSLLVQTAESIVQQHDPSQLTVGQQAELARLEALVSARTINESLLLLSDYDSSEPLIQQLAQKINWLEQEIRDLRDL